MTILAVLLSGITAFANKGDIRVVIVNGTEGRFIKVGLQTQYADNAQYISTPKSGTAMSGVATVRADGTTDNTKLSIFSTSTAPYEGIYLKVNKPANED